MNIFSKTNRRTHSVVNYCAGGSLLQLEISRNVIVMEIIGAIIFYLQFHENLVYMVSVDKKGNLIIVEK